GYFLYKKRSDEWRFDKWVFGFCSVMIVGSIFMIHPKSDPIWKLIDQLKYLQFPWRFLGLVIFFISVSVGSLVKTLPQKFSKPAVILIIAIIVVLNFN